MTDKGVSRDGDGSGRDNDRFRESRALNKGFGDGMARSFELAITPVIFGGLGWLADRWLGTAPWCLIALVVFAFAGMFVRMWVGYDNEMRRHENGMAWNRDKPTGPAGGGAA